MQRELTGWHVFGGFVAAFGVIIAVNLTLAFQAVRTFPGLEVKNSYVASQSFDADRDAQEALGWVVSADVDHDLLKLVILQDGTGIAPQVEEATFGRATSVVADQTPDFTFDGNALVAPVNAGPGNWNLRVKLRAANGVLFQQRIVVHITR
ncbi:FixH family protein [Sulfitobacter sp.]|jgi:nitrogen fixation protein FixH|uniref:FixH family protein n=1 Tax=Sulfitobacter sp. TaxID=1903071 RepID=UPI003564E7C2|tara:strand:+ start:6389 stop:6841 length:453 start_codon:yes stop_codon:yes gene_type:complete